MPFDLHAAVIKVGDDVEIMAFSVMEMSAHVGDVDTGRSQPVDRHCKAVQHDPGESRIAAGCFHCKMRQIFRGPQFAAGQSGRSADLGGFVHDHDASS